MFRFEVPGTVQIDRSWKRTYVTAPFLDAGEDLLAPAIPVWRLVRVPLILDGHEVGRIAVRELLP
jgi:hypothetical protein